MMSQQLQPIRQHHHGHPQTSPATAPRASSTPGLLSNHLPCCMLATRVTSDATTSNLSRRGSTSVNTHRPCFLVYTSTAWNHTQHHAIPSFEIHVGSTRLTLASSMKPSSPLHVSPEPTVPPTYTIIHTKSYNNTSICSWDWYLNTSHCIQMHLHDAAAMLLLISGHEGTPIAALGANHPGQPLQRQTSHRSPYQHLQSCIRPARCSQPLPPLNTIVTCSPPEIWHHSSKYTSHHQVRTLVATHHPRALG